MSLASTGRPFVQRGEGREALCRALVRVVARDGLDGVTFRSVAAEAGVTHGLASYHFGTREAMIHEALTWAARHAILESRISDNAETLGDFASDLPALIHGAPEEAVFQFDLALEAVRRRDLLNDIRQVYADYIEAVRTSLVRFGLPDDASLARLVFAALDGLTLQHLIAQDEVATTEALDVLRRLLALLLASGLEPPRAPATA
jgi:AcrR family transcriptional regulator